jgi:hypothetical protein
MNIILSIHLYIYEPDHILDSFYVSMLHNYWIETKLDKSAMIGGRGCWTVWTEGEGAGRGKKLL